MVVLNLNCLILGDGSILTMQLDDSKMVSFLQQKIARTAIDTINCAYCRLQLYVAEREGTWFLSSDSESVRKLQNGEIQDEIEDFLRENDEMCPIRGLFRYFEKYVPEEEVIHVLIRIPPTNWKRWWMIKQDVTETYADHLRDFDIHALDTNEKLEAFLSSSVHMKYPTTDVRFVDNNPEVFEYSETKIIKPDAFQYAKRDFTAFDESELLNTFFWDMVIRSPFIATAEIINLPIQIGRTLDQSTTGGSKRPDFLLWINSALVLKGEEEGSLSDFETAKVELASNTKKIHLALFGKMPFLFAYAAANSWVQFFVIDRSLNMSQISQKLNLMDLTGRIQCVLSSINICRILYHYAYESMLPRGFLPMYKELPRNNGTVMLYEDHVLKKLRHGLYDKKAVIAVYEAIRQNQIECTVLCNYNKEQRRLELWPVGSSWRPTSDSDVIAALICVSRALIGLHQLGYVHRDLFWRNILSLGKDAYMLIDFESTGRDGDPIPDDLLYSTSLDPSVLSDEKHLYRSCNDMYHLGQLIGNINNTSLQHLRMNLENSNTAKRPTAEAALSYLVNLQNGRAQPAPFPYFCE